MVHFAPTASGLVTEHYGKQPGSIFLKSCFQIIVLVKEIPHWVFFSRLYSSSSLSLSLRDRCSCPLIISGPPFCLPPMPVLHWEMQSWTQHTPDAVSPVLSSRERYPPWPTRSTAHAAEDTSLSLPHEHIPASCSSWEPPGPSVLLGKPDFQLYLHMGLHLPRCRTF